MATLQGIKEQWARIQARMSCSHLCGDKLVSKFRWRTLYHLDHLHRQEIVNQIANILASDQPTSQCR
jgi:hypothetical protein